MSVALYEVVFWWSAVRAAYLTVQPVSVRGLIQVQYPSQCGVTAGRLTLDFGLRGPGFKPLMNQLVLPLGKEINH